MSEPGEISFQSFGARISVRSRDPAILAGLDIRLPPGAKPTSGDELDTVYSLEEEVEPDGTSDCCYTLTRDEELLYGSPDLRVLQAELESDMHFQVALSARGWLFVHAGVVGWRGKAILVPGRTFSGKSSLVLALTEAGAEYYSDEYAVLDGGGRVHAYAKPLSQRQDDGSTRLIPPAELGVHPGGQGLPVGLVVVTRYQPGAAWDPVERSRGDGVMTLFDNTVVARRQAAFALETLTSAVAGALVVEGERGEAAETARLLLK